MTKKLFYIDEDTGEVEQFEGVAYSTEQLQVIQKKQDSLKRRGKEFIWFLFNYCEEIFPNLSAPNISRLFYLATFCGYDGGLTNDGGKTFMNKSQVKQQLRLNDHRFKEFWDEMRKYDILYEENKEVYINTKLFQKGKIKKKDIDSNFTRIYCQCVRNIYESCKSTIEHKKLFYIFKIIPYVNRSNNIVCWNPEEQDTKKVKPMTTGEFCDQVGYDKANARRLFKDLLSLKVNNKNLLCYIVPEWDITKWLIVINPNIYYGGSGCAETKQYFNANIQYKISDNTKL